MKQYDKGAVKRYRQVWFWLLLLVAFLPYVQAEGIITTVAGNGTEGFSGDGGPATSAQLGPSDVAVDSSGNLYIADSSNHRIRKVDIAGNISTVVGSGAIGKGNGGFSGDGGIATSAQLRYASGIAFDSSGNLYMSGHHYVRKVDVAGIISTIVGSGMTDANGNGGFSGDGGIATSAKLNYPGGIAFDSAGNLYIADPGNNRVRKADATGKISTVAGSGAIGYGHGGFSGDGGSATEAQLHYPNDVAVDSSDNLYIADSVNHRIRKVDTAGNISTVAGSGAVERDNGGFSGDGGLAINAQLNYPAGIAFDSSGNLYISENYNHRIRKVDTAGNISTVVGSGAIGRNHGDFSGDGSNATDAKLNRPDGIAVDSSGNLYIADRSNVRIRKVTFIPENPLPSTLPILGQTDNIQFTGGIGINGQAHQQRAILSLPDTVDITGNITVAPADVGKIADIFVYAEATLPPSQEVLYFMLGEGLTISLWDKNPANLVAFQREVTLNATQSVSMYSGQFVYPGTLKVFFGYRLVDGTMVTSPKPIQVTISAKGEPQFRGLVQVTPTDTDRVTLAWLPATDDNTSPDAITYQVHLSDQPNFTPSTATLQTAVTGQEKTEVLGLATGQTYNVLVVAVDQDGNESVERDYRTATTFAEPVIVSQTTQFAEDKNLGLGEATTSDGVQFTYPSGGIPPQVGSVLFANVGEDIYLRKVDSVTPTAGGGIIVQTSDAGLADVIEQGTIDTEMTSFDVNAEADRAGQHSGLRTSRSIRKDGSQYAVMRWQDDVLVAEQENFDQYGGRTTRDSEQEIGGSANATFTPSLRTKFSWHTEFGRGIVITDGEVIARGQLSLDANAFYNFKGSAEAKKEVPLFEGVFSTRHVLAGIPFMLRWVVNVKAVFSGSASSEVKANAGANATAMIEMGARYNPATDAWETLPPTPSFEKSFKAGIELQGGVHGEVRIVPNVQVDLYRTLTANLSVEPFITGDIAIQSIPKGELLKEFGYLSTQLSQFDVAFQMEGFVDLSLRFMTGFLKLSDKISLLDKTKIGELPKQMLFSLPELSVSGGSGKKNEPITLTATTKDGTNNPFKEGSVKWFVSPNKGTVSGGKAGTFTSGEEGSYTVFFSGHSYLGDPMARQFAMAEVSVGKGEEPPTPVGSCGNDEDFKKWCESVEISNTDTLVSYHADNFMVRNGCGYCTFWGLAMPRHFPDIVREQCKSFGRHIVEESMIVTCEP